MSVKRYFGLPGCGKTTTLAMLAYNGLISGKYRNVYGNVHLALPGYTYIPFDVLGRYQLEYCLILIDEAMVECGDRDHKSFGKEKLEFFVMHRHYTTDIILFSQEADGVDKKVRSISADMFYVRKPLLFGRWFSNIYKIPYDIAWPDQNDNGENLGKVVMGYSKPSFISRLFALRLWRPRWYKYFDSWEARELPPLPSKYKPCPGKLSPAPWPVMFLYKRAILLRSHRRLKSSLRKAARRQRRLDRRKQDNAAHEHLTSSLGVYDLPGGVKIRA